MSTYNSNGSIFDKSPRIHNSGSIVHQENYMERRPDMKVLANRADRVVSLLVNRLKYVEIADEGEILPLVHTSLDALELAISQWETDNRIAIHYIVEGRERYFAKDHKKPESLPAVGDRVEYQGTSYQIIEIKPSRFKPNGRDELDVVCKIIDTYEQEISE